MEAEVNEVASEAEEDSEAAEVNEAVATVEVAVAVTGTSLGLAEEPVVAEDADPSAVTSPLINPSGYNYPTGELILTKSARNLGLGE